MSITLILILVIVDHWLCMYDVTKLANPLNFAIKWIYCHFSLYIAFRSIEHWSAQVRLILLHILFTKLYTLYLKVVLVQACTRYFPVAKPSENTNILLKTSFIKIIIFLMSILHYDVTKTAYSLLYFHGKVKVSRCS